MADGTELWHQVEAAAESRDLPVTLAIWKVISLVLPQPNDVHNVVHCLIYALEEPGAIGEFFNVGTLSPFTYPEATEILADQTERDPLEVRWRCDHDIRKAKKAGSTLIPKVI